VSIDNRRDRGVIDQVMTAPTAFLPAERADAADLTEQQHAAAEMDLLRHVTEAVPDVLAVLNRQRQIVYANQRLLAMLGCACASEVHGQRPGEVLRCVHAAETAGGCGTSEFCSTCGAALAILESQHGRSTKKECRITAIDGRAYDLRVWATPYRFRDQEFTIFAMVDIGDEKRRQALERTFFHDVLNTASGLSGLAELLEAEGAADRATGFARLMRKTSAQLVDEIESQRQLLAAENDQLVVTVRGFGSVEMLDEVIDRFERLPMARDRELAVAADCLEVEVHSDRALLRRVLVNMTKNALEAVAPGARVTLACHPDGDDVRFSVHNPGIMSRDVQMQVFQRSFSSKGPGRGIGTYSMKLFGERYLGGSVGFLSDEADGTVFSIRVPLRLTPR
jgi:signal transduction histidine kinase